MFQIIYLIVLCIIIFGIIKLQILLSKKQNKFLGFILPICTFILSLILCISFSFFHIKTFTQVEIISESGQLIQTQSEIFPTTIHNTSFISSIIYIFITINILTIIFLIIYLIQRKKLSTKNELKKMHISDL